MGVALTVHLAGLRALLVEDSPGDAALTADLLEDALPGTDLTVARRLDEALGHAASGFDVALVDLSLPDADGLQALHALRDVIPRTALVVLTGNEDDELVHRALVAGAQDYLAKSGLTADALRRAVRHALSRARAEEQVRRSQAWAQSVLDAVQHPTCVLDQSGAVVAVNAAWREVSRRGGGAAGRSGVGAHYLDVCDRAGDDPAAGPEDREVARRTAAGLRSLLASGTGRLEVEYPCHVEGLHHWFALRAVPAADGAGAVVSHMDVTALRRAQDSLTHAGLHDQLTGLPNRAWLDTELDRRLAERAPGTAVAVLFVDLDRFRAVNDAYGHPAGDALLVAVADALREAVRPGDVVTRHAGDEFVVVADVEGDAEAVALADRLQAATCRPFTVAHQSLVLSCSQGLAVASDAWSGDGDALLLAADAARGEAKTKGRGRVELFTQGLRDRARAQASLHRELLLALEREELEVHYQPVVDVVAGGVTAVEALVRWRHPERGLLLPGAFLDVAEATGLTAPLGTAVLRQACTTAAAWHADGLGLRVAVNLSAHQLSSAGTVAAVEQALADSGLAPGSLVLEVTETAVIEDPVRARAALRAVSALGVTVAVDDFGTGWSTLAYLTRYPVDGIKVDRSFVRDLTTSAEDRSIVSSVAALARQLRMWVVAEGVETAEQVEVLRGLGCRLLQGFAFSPAVPASEVPALVARLGRAPQTGAPAPSRSRRSSDVDAEVLERLRCLHRQGASLNTIAAALNGDGVLTPQGVRWHARSVGRQLMAAATTASPGTGPAEPAVRGHHG